MHPVHWTRILLAILGTGLATAVAAACLPDNPYQRWQLIAGTLYENATWAYERTHFDPRPVDVAVIGPSRALLGLSAPRIEARLNALGKPVTVVNMAIVEDGRNIQWAIVDELYKAKRPKLLIIHVSEENNRWGHPGFKYVAPAAAIAWPPQPLLHNSLYDIAYLPYRQMKLAAAAVFPQAFGLPKTFNQTAYAGKVIDFTETRRMPDGVLIDMDSYHAAAELTAAEAKFKATQRPSRIPKALTTITDADSPVYVGAIARLAAAHGTKLMFVYLPKFGGPATIQGHEFYERMGPIVSNADLARDNRMFSSFAHLNHAGAMIASDRAATVAAGLL